MVLRPHAKRRRVALAIAALCLAPAAGAQITTVGAVGTYPVFALAIGPGDTFLGNNTLWVGNGGFGSLDAVGGVTLQSGALAVGLGGTGASDGVVNFAGAGTLVQLTGDGYSDGLVNRFGVGEWGRGVVTVSAGAVLDGRAMAAACTGAVVVQYCNNFVGNAAGSDGTLTVTGPGSRASFLSGFYVGGLAVFRPPVDGFTFGTPGGTTTGRVNVLDGGTLETDRPVLGVAPGGGSPTGTERSFAEAVIGGAGSVWRVSGGTLDGSRARFETATHRNAWATLAVEAGGLLSIDGPSGDVYNNLDLTSGGGRTDARVTGPGSRISFTRASGILHVGQSLGTASLEVGAGGQVDGMFYLGVGRNGSAGNLVVDGAESLVRVDGTATAAANGVSGLAYMEVGRNGGNGTVTLRNGARLEVLASSFATNGTGMGMARDANSSGTLNIDSGAVALFRSTSSAPGTADETRNPVVLVGRDGSATLNIAGGGQLRVEGGAASTPDHLRGTALYLGGSGGNPAGGGRAVASVSGPGSLLSVSGADAFLAVGFGATGSGNLAVSDGARVEATIMHVGSSGGVGVVRLDGASVDLSGQYAGGSGQPGAALVIGSGAGAVGNLAAVNGSAIRIANDAGNGGGISIGGRTGQAGGDGVLTLSASSLVFDIPTGNGGMNVGRSGSGLLRMSNGSAVDLGSNVLYVAREAGSDGAVIATGGSTITAGWVGVGRNQNGGGDGSDGGTGTMVLNGATLFAQDVVIGTNGYLGGSAGSIVVSGSVVNYGIFSPGSSPGDFSIAGSFVAGASSRLVLEIEALAGGGFATDVLRFDAGATVEFGGSSIEFRFLGATNPNAFAASGAFDVATFLQQGDGSGNFAGLASEQLAGVAFTALSDEYPIIDFEFDPLTGSFSVVAVPEPGSWVLMAGGLLLVGCVVGRRRRLN